MAFRICHKSTCFVEKKNGVETERKRLLSYASCLKKKRLRYSANIDFRADEV